MQHAIRTKRRLVMGCNSLKFMKLYPVDETQDQRITLQIGQRSRGLTDPWLALRFRAQRLGLSLQAGCLPLDFTAAHIHHHAG